MENDDREKKGFGGGSGAFTKDDVTAGETSVRARNRTVMLTPEITDQVRQRLAKELDPIPAAPKAADTGRGFAPLSRGEPPPMHPGYGVSAPQPTTGLKTGAIWQKPSPVIGFMVSYDKDTNGEIFDLRVGRLAVTSEVGTSGSYIHIHDETVSPMHAIMRISSTGEIQLLDQLSEHGTKVKRANGGQVDELSGDKALVYHGDTIFFGKRSFHVCMVSRS
jgi:hypothetical protein